MRRPPAVLLLLLACLPFLAGTCYKPGTCVVVFVQGVYTTLDAEGTQGTLSEAHRFDTMKAAFVAKGYRADRLLDFSYAGGTMNASGQWKPAPYECEETDRATLDNVAVLEEMLRDYRAKHRDAHFALVGHSLGGYVVFVAAARDAARPPSERLGIDVAATLDAPLLGVSPDKKVIFDFVACDKTYLAGADLVAARLDPATPSVRLYQSVVMAQAGVRLGTFGNTADCLWNTRRCLGGDWADDTNTQFLPDQAAVSMSYDVPADPLASHDAILADATAVADVVGFVGAP